MHNDDRRWDWLAWLFWAVIFGLLIYVSCPCLGP
jgi:hypothetical protein